MNRFDALTEALIACYEYFVERRTTGARELYDAVNDCWVWTGRH